MDILLSINKKFFGKTPEELIKLVKKYDTKKIIKGFEIYIDFDNEIEKSYMKELCNICKKEQYIFQIHGMECGYKKQFEYMDFVNELTKIMQKSINVVIHPVSKENIEEAILDSIECFNKIIGYIEKNNYNINISIENLNYLGMRRIGKESVLPIFEKVDNLNFTYDMGHEIIDNKNVDNLPNYLRNKIINIHLHTFKESFDHQPIGITEDVSDKWRECLKYLESTKYDKNMVLEYDFYTLGDNYEERLQNYIRSANVIADILNS